MAARESTASISFPKSKYVHLNSISGRKFPADLTFRFYICLSSCLLNIRREVLENGLQDRKYWSEDYKKMAFIFNFTRCLPLSSVDKSRY